MQVKCAEVAIQILPHDILQMLHLTNLSAINVIINDDHRTARKGNSSVDSTVHSLVASMSTVPGCVSMLTNSWLSKQPLPSQKRRMYPNSEVKVLTGECIMWNITQCGCVLAIDRDSFSSIHTEILTASGAAVRNQHVRRVYDEEHQTLLYISYSTRLTQDMQEQNARYRTSVTAISLAQQDVKITLSS